MICHSLKTNRKHRIREFLADLFGALTIVCLAVALFAASFVLGAETNADFNRHNPEAFQSE
jgi:hypothetical protein